MPPFSLDALNAALAKHVHVPPDEVETIATQVFGRYEGSGPPGTAWRLRTLTTRQSDGRDYVAYDLCRADWSGGVYFSQSSKIVQSIADALNELEGNATPPDKL